MTLVHDKCNRMATYSSLYGVVPPSRQQQKRGPSRTASWPESFSRSDSSRGRGTVRFSGVIKVSMMRFIMWEEVVPALSAGSAHQAPLLPPHYDDSFTDGTHRPSNCASPGASSPPRCDCRCLDGPVSPSPPGSNRRRDNAAKATSKEEVREDIQK